MKKIELNKIRHKDNEVFEHLEFIVKNTTPYQRYKVLEEMWDLWFRIRKTLPERIIKLQDKFRRGDI